MVLRRATYYGDENEITVIPCLRFIALDLDFSPSINNINVLENFIDVCASNTCSMVTGITTQLEQTAIFIATHMNILY